MALTISDPNIAKLDSLIKQAVPKGSKGIKFLENMLREITFKRPQDVGSKKYLLLAGELQARKNTAEKMKGAGPKPPSVIQSLTAPAPQDGLGLDMSQPAVRNLAAQNQMATIGGKPPAGKGGGIVAFQSTGFVNLQEILKGIDDEDERARVETLLRSGRNPFPEKIKGDKLIPGQRYYKQVDNPDYALTQRFLDENPTGMAPGIGFNRAKDTEIKQNYLANLEKAMAGVDPSQTPVAPPQINPVTETKTTTSDRDAARFSLANAFKRGQEQANLQKVETSDIGGLQPSVERRGDGITVENLSASTDLPPSMPISDPLDAATLLKQNRTMFASDFPVQGKGLMAQLSPQDQAILKEPDVNVLYKKQIAKDKALYGDETKNRVDLINESMKGLKGLKKKLGYEALLVFAGEMGSTPGSILDAISKGTKAATPTIIKGLEKIKDNTEKLKFKEAELKDLLVKRDNTITKSARDSIDKKVEKAQANRTNTINTNRKDLTKLSATITNAQLTTQQRKITNELKANELNITRAKYKNDIEFKAAKAQAEMINDVFNSIIQAKAKELGAALDEDDFETYMKQAKRLVFNRTVTPPQ
tara:strand:+ start:1210 stop:2979 length:1770 start_codon:yes stop_codon:yes gene_type:complete